MWVKYTLYLITTLCLLAGCAFLGLKHQDPFIASFPYPGPPAKIWSAIQDALVSYRTLPSRIDYEKGTLETEWNTILGVGRYESTRRKIHLKLAPAEIPDAPPDSYVVKIWVEVQCNKTMAPIDRPELMKWKSAGSDENEAERILWKLYFSLLPQEKLEQYLKDKAESDAEDSDHK